MTLSPRLLTLLVATNLALLAVMVLTALTGCKPVQVSPARATFQELTAERINLVGADGKLVMALSNKARIAGPVMGGKAYPVGVSEGREQMAGMIFFNQDGDEMGGLVFNSWRRPDGRIAGIGHLSFDRFQDNQVLALQYKENATTVQSGLTVYDRPGTGAFKASLDLIEEARTATPDRLAEIRRLLAERSGNGELGVERIFLGSRNRAAQLLLRDSKGRVKARLLIDDSEAARLEFLDDQGKVTARFPG